MNNDNVEIRESRIAGRGVFARRDFKLGEVVLNWNPLRKLSAAETGSLTIAELHYVVALPEGMFLLMGEPERYVNHSCSPNTKSADNSDIAVRDISVGEEITSNYGSDNSLVEFECNCGSPQCVARHRF